MQPRYRHDLDTRLQRRISARQAARRRDRIRRVGRIALLTLAAALTVGLGLSVYTWVTAERIISAVAAPDHTSGADLNVALRPVPVQPRERINILVLGVDKDQVRTDVMILVGFDPESGSVNALWIPRDTRAMLIPQGFEEKINHAYAVGEGETWRDPAVRAERPFRSMKTVGHLLGVEVHYHVTVNFRAFTQMIDRIGGVSFNVPMDMDYEDPYQDLVIHLKAGQQRLSGDQAVQLARWRHNNDLSIGYPDGDLGRIRTQQQLLRAILNQLMTAKNLPKLPSIAVDSAQYVKTNMDEATIKRLVRYLPGLRQEDIHLHALAGDHQLIYSDMYKARQDYFLPSPESLQQFSDLFNGVDRAANAAIRVEVAGPEGPGNPAVREVMDRLSALGFQVLPATTDPRVPPATTVIDRRGDAARQEQVIHNLRVALGTDVLGASDVNGDSPADVRVLVGRELTGLNLPR